MEERQVSEELKYVLVVDDEPRVLEALRDAMELFGYPVLSATNGEEGLLQFEAYGPAIGVMVIDAQMPIMDGWRLLEAIRKRDPWMPVIFSSGNVDSRLAQKLQADDDRLFMLHKPYTLDELRTHIRLALELP